MNESPEARFHRAISRRLSKREQGYVMSAFREAIQIPDQALAEKFEAAANAGTDWNEVNITSIKPIERDEAMGRTYIPLPGGWEVQTQGTGSTFRICDPKGDRLPIPDSPYLHETLERMARAVNAAWKASAASAPSAPTPARHEMTVAWLVADLRNEGCKAEATLIEGLAAECGTVNPTFDPWCSACEEPQPNVQQENKS